MMEYRATVNLPECRRNKTAWFDESPRTTILVGQGVLIPVTPRLDEPFEAAETLDWDAPPFVMPVSEAAAAPTGDESAEPENFTGADEADEAAALARYEAAVASGLSEAEAREEGWPAAVEPD